MADEPAVRVTLSDIYKQGQATQAAVGTLESEVKSFTKTQEVMQQSIKTFEARIRRLEVQIAVQWVVVGIVLAAVTSAVTTLFSGKV